MASGTRKRVAAADQSSLVDYLPRLLHYIQSAVRDRARVQDCIEALCAVPGGLFRSCAVLQSRPLEPFVVVGRFGAADRDDRAWIRWPLQRLFVMRRAAVLEHPILAVRALALPLLHQGVRTVLILQLEHAPQSQDEQLLLAVLSAMSLDSEALAADIQTIGTPEFLWLGTDAVARDSIERIVRTRAWRIRSYSRLAEVIEEARKCAVPVICVDRTVTDPTQIVRTLRSVCGSRVTIVTVGPVVIPAPELRVLVDQSIASELSEKRSLDLLKAALQRSMAARVRETDAKVQNAKALIEDASGIDQLASEAARATARFVDGWANVQLVDSSGFVSLGEYPAISPPVATILPNFFLETRPLLSTKVDDEFFAFVTSDDRARDRLRALNLKSGACIPLVDGERILGTLLTGSMQSALERNELEALLQIAAQITLRAHSLSAHKTAEEYYSERRWTHIKESGGEIRVYRPADSPVNAWLAKIDPHRSLLVLAEPERVEGIVNMLSPLERCAERPRETLARLANFSTNAAFFVAVVEYAGSTIAFAAHGMPAPILWNIAGPHGEIETHGNMCFGILSLNGSGCAYIGETHRFDCAGKSPSQLRAAIDDEQPPVIIGCITMRSLAAE
ncbi:MAG: GAF domain-containing protein [Candidatus Eremiobacteraeota bacterium]|nr:GAF domain-containing protein [Candidatus Eremiobacteraeota bacterium]